MLAPSTPVVKEVMRLTQRRRGKARDLPRRNQAAAGPAGGPPPGLRLTWSNRAVRDSDRLDPKVRKRIVVALERYAETRYGDVAKLAGMDPPEYRLRVGQWRVRFAWDQTATVMTVLHVFGRGQGYE